ncbi:hypothetical protein LE181_01290 [Streptomyces sp. SCA3-4]|uniref:hypothetical protein n=1 Tax=Streptomyces sichuanensis TaxID=2871810 RepID=UPI001CE27ED1|nr:hypothetical protein [Streptomyces sichuanensis]MCA6090817.1 hypothetical protein [Streptomyces sichuanensis]
MALPERHEAPAVCGALPSRTSRPVVLAGRFRLPARRGAEEQTGCRAGELRPALVTSPAPQPGSGRTHLSTASTAEDDPAVRTGPGGVAEEGEDVRLPEPPLEEALAQAPRQPAADATTLLLLPHARDRGLCDPPGSHLPAVPEEKGRPS